MAEKVPIDPQQTAPVRGINAWRAVTLLALAISLPTFLALGARGWWVLELATHFRVYYAGLFLIVTAVFLLGRQWKQVVFCALVLIWNLIGIVPFYFGRTTPAPNSLQFRVITANVHTANRNHQALIDLVHLEQPDILLAIEVDDRWIKSLSVLDEEYPHRITLPRSDNFGIAFYSRLPVESLEFKELGESEVPAVIARLKREGEEITVIGVHTLPPVNQDYASTRNRQMASTAELARQTSGPVIALGDFNITPWSPFFHDFLERSQLHDGRHGFGIQPTWTGGRAFMKIPIDHIFVSQNIAVTSLRVGPDIGSDHQSVIADIALPR